MRYRSLIKRNLPRAFVAVYLAGLPNIYREAYETATSRFVGNVPHLCGTIRWGLSEDFFHTCLLVAGMAAARRSANNGIVHVEGYADDCVFIQKKVDEPGKLGNAKYRQALAAKNLQLPLGPEFEDLAEKLDRETPDDRFLVDITHTPDENDSSSVAAVTVTIEGPDGVIDSFPLSSLYNDLGSDGGVEIVPDNVSPVPRAGAGTGAN